MHKETDFSASPALDIWAIGIIMYMTLFNSYPFKGELSEIPKKIIADEWALPEKTGTGKFISKEAEHILKQMLAANPA